MPVACVESEEKSDATSPISIQTELPTISTGSRFSSFAEFEAAFELWKRTYCHAFRVASSETLRQPDGTVYEAFKYRYIVYHCAHYGKPRMRGIGKRPNQNYLPCGCKAMLRLNFNYADNALRITTLNDVHTGHDTTPESFARVSAKCRRFSPSSAGSAGQSPSGLSTETSATANGSSLIQAYQQQLHSTSQPVSNVNHASIFQPHSSTSTECIAPTLSSIFASMAPPQNLNDSAANQTAHAKLLMQSFASNPSTGGLMPNQLPSSAFSPLPNIPPNVALQQMPTAKDLSLAIIYNALSTLPQETLLSLAIGVQRQQMLQHQYNEAAKLIQSATAPSLSTAANPLMQSMFSQISLQQPTQTANAKASDVPRIIPPSTSQQKMPSSAPNLLADPSQNSLEQKAIYSLLQMTGQEKERLPEPMENALLVELGEHLSSTNTSEGSAYSSAATSRTASSAAASVPQSPDIPPVRLSENEDAPNKESTAGLSQQWYAVQDLYLKLIDQQNGKDNSSRPPLQVTTSQ